LISSTQQANVCLSNTSLQLWSNKIINID
jgi:hypothetical protein